MIVKKVIMTKLSNNENKLRTKEVIGEPAFYPPKEGESFIVVGEPLEIDKGFRIVQTSAVQKIVRNEIGYVISTENSRYLIEELEVVPEPQDLIT